MTIPNEEHGDCGDDDSGIMLHCTSGVDVLTNLTSDIIPECDDLAFHECSSSRSSSFPSSSPSDQDQEINRPFPVYNWQISGSDVGEHIDQSDCQQFSSPHAWRTYLTSNHKQGYVDILEICGGAGGTIKACVRRGLRSGPNQDIVCGIDLTNQACVDQLWKYISICKPKVIIMAPPCTAFSQMANMNKHKPGWRISLVIGEKIAKLCCEIAHHQLDSDLDFLIENPTGSGLWRLPYFDQLIKRTSNTTSILHQCAYGLVDPDGIPTQKTTMFLASHDDLLTKLDKQCPGNHEHVPILGSTNGIARAKFAQEWPRQLCEAVAHGCQTVIHNRRKQLTYQVQVCYPSGSSSTSNKAESLPECPGCRGNLVKTHPKHNRGPTCRYRTVETIPLREFPCPECKRNISKMNAAQHNYDQTCKYSAEDLDQLRQRSDAVHGEHGFPPHSQASHDPTSFEPTTPTNPIRDADEDGNVGTRGADQTQRHRREYKEEGVQAESEDTAAWTDFDLGRAASVLRTGTPSQIRRIIRRLHTRWYHASADKMTQIFELAGVPEAVIKLVQGICETCRICRLWQRPSPKPKTHTRISTNFNQAIQLDLIFWSNLVVFHIIDPLDVHGLNLYRTRKKKLSSTPYEEADVNSSKLRKLLSLIVRPVSRKATL